MQKQAITIEHIQQFQRHLRREERSAGTIENYLRHLRQFAAFLDGGPVTKERTRAWKDHLMERGYAPVSVNAMLASVNKFLDWISWTECRVKPLRIQRKLFRDASRELSRGEYLRLAETARDLGRERLALLMETICATGIRVSELRYITVEAAQRGRADISLKGKIRTILLPGNLRRKLLKYAQAQKTASGEIFLTRGGAGISRKQIWAEMKQLCRQADVPPGKVFPHNLRHLFARTFYRVCRDLSRLADVLGHASLETTRIYLLSSGTEHVHTLEKLHLLL